MKNFSARVVNPNTPESDLEPRVLHVVSYYDELDEPRTVQLMAECPIDAIKQAKKELRAEARANRCAVCDDDLNEEALEVGRDVCFDCYFDAND